MAVENERVVEIERRIEAPREEVFVYLTDPDRYTRWMGMAAELDPRPGGVYRVRMNSDTVALGAYVAVEPPSRVVFTWGWEVDTADPPGSTAVEITLRDDGEGTILRLRHSGFTTDEAAATHRAGWAMYVERLSVATPGGDPGPRPHRTRSGRIGSEDLDDVPDELGTPHRRSQAGAAGRVPRSRPSNARTQSRLRGTVRRAGLRPRRTRRGGR